MPVLGAPLRGHLGPLTSAFGAPGEHASWTPRLEDSFCCFVRVGWPLEKFARTLAVAEAAGIAIPLLAEASGLTASRIHARPQKQRTLPRHLHMLADEEITEVLEHAFAVAIVAAGRGGYSEYRRYAAYICQAG